MKISSIYYHGQQGHSWLTMVSTMGCRGISVLMPGAPPLPPSSLISVSVELLFSHSHLSLPAAAVAQNFFPLLFKYIISDVQPLSLMGLALASGGSILEPAGLVSVGMGQASGSFSQESLLYPCVTKTLLRKACTIALSQILLFKNVRLNHVTVTVSKCYLMSRNCTETLSDWVISTHSPNPTNH